MLSVSAVALASAAVDAAAPASDVARWVAGAERVGPADEAQKVTISLYLSFRNQEELDRLAEAVATPGSKEYGRYLAPAQFHERFAPDAAKVALVQDTLRKLGFTVGHTAASGFYVEAEGTVGLIEHAFRVNQDLYRIQGKVLRANAEEPTLPARLAGIVSHVGGLAETGLLRHPYLAGRDERPRTAPQGMSPDGVIPPEPYPLVPATVCSKYWGDHSATLSTAADTYGTKLPWLNCGYTPQQLRLAYGADKVKLDGTGVTVAIVDAYAAPTLRADANQYAKKHGLPALTSKNFGEDIPLGIYTVSPGEACGPQGWFVEQSLDVAAVHSMAPGASILYVGARDCGISLDDTLYDAIDGGAAQIITNSYGFVGDPLSASEEAVFNQEYIQARVEGITLLFSSGDSGDVSQLTGVMQADWPASSVHVTAVGGTTLELLDRNGTKTEHGWGNYRAYLANANTDAAGTKITDSGTTPPYTFYAGAGGGPSLTEPQPRWQAKVVPANLAGYTYTLQGAPVELVPAKRVVPDVAMVADPYSGFLVGESFTPTTAGTADPGCVLESGNGLEYCEFGEGGTSLASPAFAGVMALVTQQRMANMVPPLGFLNPRLYALKVGAPGATTTPLVDVQAPAAPDALLRGYAGALTTVRVVTLNSVPSTNCPGGTCEGLDDNFLYTTAGYDDVTGLGTPYLPALVTALGR